MHVLIPDTTTGDARRIADDLVARGHEVHTCGTGDGRVSCAMLGELPCPLDATLVDVAVAVRPPGDAAGTGDGALCAIRKRIPLVLAGDHIDHPLLPWATAAAISEDAADLAEEVAGDPLSDHSHLARRALVDQLAHQGLAAEGAHAEVRRRDGTLTVDLWPGCPIGRWASGVVADHVLQRLRAFDRWARIVDVTVHPEPVPAGSARI